MKLEIQATKAQIEKANYMIRNSGGVVRKNCSFEVGGVVGHYVFNEDKCTVVVEITDKPWLASWDMIEDEINKFFA